MIRYYSIYVERISITTIFPVRQFVRRRHVRQRVVRLNPSDGLIWSPFLIQRSSDLWPVLTGETGQPREIEEKALVYNKWWILLRVFCHSMAFGTQLPWLTPPTNSTPHVTVDYCWTSVETTTDRKSHTTATKIYFQKRIFPAQAVSSNANLCANA